MPMVEFAVNNTPSEATGQTPFVLNYGVHPQHHVVAELVSKVHVDTTNLAIACPILLDAICMVLRDVPNVPAAAKFVRDMQAAIHRPKVMIQAARLRMQQQGKSKRTRRVPFQVGDMVMLSTKYLKLAYNGCPQLVPRFVGPFRVAAVMNPLAFRLESPGHMRVHNVFHASLLKPFVKRPGEEYDPLPTEVDDEQQYEVEALVNRRKKCHRTSKCKHGTKQSFRYEYLVRWQGYGHEHDEWLPEAELARNYTTLIREYNSRIPRD